MSPCSQFCLKRYAKNFLSACERAVFIFNSFFCKNSDNSGNSGYSSNNNNKLIQIVLAIDYTFVDSFALAAWRLRRPKSIVGHRPSPSPTCPTPSPTRPTATRNALQSSYGSFVLADLNFFLYPAPLKKLQQGISALCKFIFHRRMCKGKIIGINSLINLYELKTEVIITMWRIYNINTPLIYITTINAKD